MERPARWCRYWPTPRSQAEDRTDTLNPMETLARSDADTIAAGLVPFYPHVLLTAAGFSKIWGGFLAAELWGLVVSDPRVRARSNIDQLLHASLNFEDALARAEVTQRDNYDEEDRVALRGAVLRAFELQDERIRYNSGNTIRLRAFIGRFIPDEGRTGCLFSLNQDTVLERYLLYGDSPAVLMPGVTDPEWRFGRRSTSAPWTQATAAVPVLPFDRAQFDCAKGRLSYIKLHGSADWTTADGRGVVVLGGAKEEAISRFPILEMNNALFRAALTAHTDQKLVVVGYGFGDDHINGAILQGVERGLRLWIIDPRSPRDLREHLMSLQSCDGTAIFEAIAGYSPVSFDWFMGGDEFYLTRLRSDFLCY
jgi:hypothetical protein